MKQPLADNNSRCAALPSCVGPPAGVMRYVRRRRVVELCAIALALPLLLPVCATVALAVRCSSPGPVLFRQRRPGYRGVIFTMLKFRTMHGAESGSAGHDAQRITPVGRFLRRHRLDELPQLWNVVRGEMSLIGPRPHPLALDALYRQQVEGYTLRTAVPPGITGWAQIHLGHFSGLRDAAATTAYDLYYIAHLSPGLDVTIALRTVAVMVGGLGAR